MPEERKGDLFTFCNVVSGSKFIEKKSKRSGSGERQKERKLKRISKMSPFDCTSSMTF